MLAGGSRLTNDDIPRLTSSLERSLTELQGATKDARALVQHVDKQVDPLMADLLPAVRRLDTTLKATEQTLQSVSGHLRDDSALAARGEEHVAGPAIDVGCGDGAAAHTSMNILKHCCEARKSETENGHGAVCLRRDRPARRAVWLRHVAAGALLRAERAGSDVRGKDRQRRRLVRPIQGGGRTCSALRSSSGTRISNCSWRSSTVGR